MGCSSSILTAYPKGQNPLGLTSLTSKGVSEKNHVFNVLPPNFALPSTGGLQIILQTVFLRESMRKFVSQAWVPVIISPLASGHYDTKKSSSNTAKTKLTLDLHKAKIQEMRDLALNSIDFWTDVHDFKAISMPSRFKSYRGCQIFEKYIMHGASKPVPISLNVLDDCTDAFFSDPEDRLPSDVFAAADSEILDYLIAEVFPSFEKISLSSVARKHASNVMQAIWGDPSSRRRKSLFNSSKQTALIQIMTSVLLEPEHFESFRCHLLSLGSGAESILYAYNETVEIRDRISQLAEISSEKDLKMGNFLFHVNNFYDTYLCLGAPFRVPVSEATMGDTMRRLSQCSAADADVLLPIEQETFECLIRDHLDNFLSSSEYFELVRGGNHTISRLISGLSLNTSASAANTSTEPDKFSDRTNAQAVLDGSNNNDREVADSFTPELVQTQTPVTSTSLHPFDSPSKRELKNFLRSGYDSTLGRYLRQQGSHNNNTSTLSLMHFYQSAYRFQEAQFPNDMERIAECGCIFDRYISRNADEPVGIPEEKRSTIVRSLLRAPQSIFQDSAEWAIQLLHDNHWEGFKHEVYRHYPDATRATGDSPSLAGESDPTGACNLAARGSAMMMNVQGTTAASELAALAEKLYPKANGGSGVTLNALAVVVGPGGSGGGRRASLLAAGVTALTAMIGVSHSNGAHQTQVQTKYSSNSGEAQQESKLDTAAGNGDDDRSEMISNITAIQRSSSRRKSIDRLKKSMAMASSPALGASASTGAGYRRRFSLVANPPTNAASGSGSSSPTASIPSVNSSSSTGTGPESSGSSNDSYRSAGSFTGSSNGNVAGVFRSTPPPLMVGESSYSLTTTRASFKLLGGGRMGYKRGPPTCKEVLENSRCCRIFKEFLDKECAAQTVMFLMEIEEYCRIPNASFQQKMSKKIFNKFIHELAIMPVPISDETRKKVHDGIYEQSKSFNSPTLFAQANEEVRRYIEMYQYPRFQRTSEFTNILQVFHGGGADEATRTRHRSSIIITEASSKIVEIKTMKDILAYQGPARFFREFCIKTYCHESILFWLDAEHFVNLPGSDYMKRTAIKICKKFISDDARLQINISSNVRDDIFKNLSQPTRLLFKRAQDEVFYLLETDIFPKFVKSDEFKSMLKYIETTRPAVTPAASELDRNASMEINGVLRMNGQSHKFVQLGNSSSGSLRNNKVVSGWFQ